MPHVDDQLRDLRAPAGSARHLLVMAKSMNFIDLSAAELWRQELMIRRSIGGDLYFHRPRAPVLQVWNKVGFMAELGADHVFPAKHAAIATIFGRLDRGICAHCTVRVFEECAMLPAPVAPFHRAAIIGCRRSAGIGRFRSAGGAMSSARPSSTTSVAARVPDRGTGA